jgi:acyl-CoA thioesterase FadM
MNYIHAINSWENSIIVESAISEVKASKLIFKHKIKSGKTKMEMAFGESSIVCLRSGKMLMSFHGWIAERIDNYIKNFQKGISLE